MNITVENLGPCKKLLRIEVDVATVDAAIDKATTDVMRQARLPGFRPGKAPRHLVAKSHAEDIQEEAKRRLSGESYQAGIKQEKLNVLRVLEFEEVQFAAGQPATFAVTVELAPDFQMPEYRGLAAKREQAAVTPADIERAINTLRGQQSRFDKVDRESREGDFLVVNYTGTCEGKPITDLAPTARGLTEKKNFWIELIPDSFIPGFFEQLKGAKAGEHRTVNVNFPADFVTPQLAGKQGAYAVEVLEVKERILPDLNDEFAKSYGADNVEALREGVRSDLQNELNLRQKRNVRNQLVADLAAKIQFDLPESLVEAETRSVVYEIVSENQRRGVSRELIEEQKDGIYSAAATTARERVKLRFLFHHIAEKEGIRGTQEEMSARIAAIAANMQTTPDKLVKDLQKRDAMGEVYEQVVHEKVITFLQENARIEDIAVPQA